VAAPCRCSTVTIKHSHACHTQQTLATHAVGSVHTAMTYTAGTMDSTVNSESIFKFLNFYDFGAQIPWPCTLPYRVNISAWHTEACRGSNALTQVRACWRAGPVVNIRRPTGACRRCQHMVWSAVGSTCCSVPWSDRSHAARTWSDARPWRHIGRCLYAWRPSAAVCRRHRRRRSVWSPTTKLDVTSAETSASLRHDDTQVMENLRPRRISSQSAVIGAVRRSLLGRTRRW